MPIPHLTSLPEKRVFQRSLLRWYKINKRDLPWRQSQDPYRILVSEFMLQQTRVKTVIPYFTRFLKLFPTLPDLARAPLQSVLRAWAGLGYYARAHHLYAAAKTIWRDSGGKIPSTKNQLLSLPGFGPYIAGAVASLAFNEPEAALDGNAKRVLRRQMNVHLKGPAATQEKMLEKVAEDLIPPGKAAEFNQALMELGGMICIPLRPRCPICPVNIFCAWQGEEKAGKDRKKKIRNEIWAVALVEEEGRFLMQRKEGKGLLAGLWQFPNTVLAVERNFNKKHFREENKRNREALKKMLCDHFGLRVRIKKSLPLIEHQFTHIHVTIKPYLCSYVSLLQSDSFPKSARWIKPSNLSRYPISRAMDKIAALI